jgi:hypothetical protein
MKRPPTVKKDRISPGVSPRAQRLQGKYKTQYLDSASGTADRAQPLLQLRYIHGGIAGPDCLAFQSLDHILSEQLLERENHDPFREHR